jgi:hypothetical protein
VEITLRHATVVGALALLVGALLLALVKGLVSSMLSAIVPHSVFEVVGLVAEVILFVSLAKKLLGLAPMYNRLRIWLFMGSLLALLFAMCEEGHCNGPLFVQKVGQLAMLAWFILVWKPAHGPMVRCPWKWAFGLKGLVICFLIGKWVSGLVSEAPLPDNGFLFAIGIKGVVLTFVGMVLVAAGKLDGHGITFLVMYGVGNAMLAISNLGQFSAPALCITTALTAVVCWALVEKAIHGAHARYKYGKAKKPQPEKCVDTPVPDSIPVGVPVVVRIALPVLEPVEGPVLVAERVPVAQPVTTK